MSRLDELILELCPNGVEYKQLKDLGVFYGGLTGKSKDDFENGNKIFITYKNVYSNPSLDLHPAERVKIGEAENQRTLKYGDVIFTGSSETPDECGISSVVTEIPQDDLYLNSFCFIFRFDDLNGIYPPFMKHLFRSSSIRKQIGRTANGVTRYNVSKKLMAKISIPIPPMEIQKEIVCLLDDFTAKTAELQAELNKEYEARKKQYEYYRETVLNDNLDSMTVKIGDVADLKAGATPKTSNPEFWENGTIPWMSSGEVNQGKVTYTEKKITELGYNSSSTKMLPSETVVIALAGQGKTRGTVAITQIPLCTNQSLCGICAKDELNSMYLYHYLKSRYEDLRAISNGDGTRGGLNLKMIANYDIPLPPLEVQMKIVNILDKLDSINNDMYSSINNEIESRQKQYEFYRDKLLTFKELK